MSSFHSFNTNNKKAFHSGSTGVDVTKGDTAYVSDESDEETTNRCCSKCCASCGYCISTFCVRKCPNVIFKLFARACLKKKKKKKTKSTTSKPILRRNFQALIAAQSSSRALNIKRFPATGYLEKPKLKFNTTLGQARKASHLFLAEQRHITMDEHGNLIYPNPEKFSTEEMGRELEEDMEQEEPKILSSVNYVLQLKLDQVIAMPCRPVDGYDEALFESDRTSIADPISKNRRVSESRISISSLPSSMMNLNSIRKSTTQGRERGPQGLAAMSTPLFLALLPTLSDELGHELMGNVGACLSYCQVLESTFSSAPSKIKNKYSSERWLAVVYIDYGPSKGMGAFRRLLVRFILHTYLIAFEERDVNRIEVYKEFLNRPKPTRHFNLPYVYSHGIPIGSSDIMFTLHTQGKVTKIFKCSTMDPDSYNQWLHSSVENGVREQLMLKVPIPVFPLVRQAMRDGSNIDTSQYAEQVDLLTEGISVLMRAQRLWNEKLQNKYVEPRMLLYIQLDSTIWNVLYMMEEKMQEIIEGRE